MNRLPRVHKALGLSPLMDLEMEVFSIINNSPGLEIRTEKSSIHAQVSQQNLGAETSQLFNGTKTTM